MDTASRIRAALNQNQQLEALDALVEDLHREGWSKPAIYIKLRTYSEHLGIDDEPRDHLLEVLDFLSGFCSPHMRLIPDEPDVVL